MRLLYVSRFSGIHDQRFVDAWRGAGLEVLQLQVEYSDFKSKQQFEEQIEIFKPDLVQVGPLNDPGAFVAGYWDGPLIAASWGFDLLADSRLDPVSARHVNFTLKRADVVFSDNPAVSQEAIKLGCEKQKIVEFPWGVSQQWLELPLRQFVPSKKLTFICTRHHDEIYRVQDVLEGFSLSQASKMGSELVLVGEGPLTQKLKDRTKHLNLENQVHFVGRKSSQEIQQLLINSDVYVSSSSTDGSSISLLEAMAVGIPVLISNIPGNAHWVSSQTGFCFELGDIVSISNGMDYFLPSDISISLEINSRVQSAQTLIKQEANWDKTASNFLEYANVAISHFNKSRGTR